MANNMVTTNKKLTLVIVQLRRGTYCARKLYFSSIPIISINYKKYIR